ncbi:hypothetical protein [Aestuariivita sp.]|jgi:short-subunit dehydrogenase|uniref:hypothetical protein n=1 Tax=Aestuariivita sp. TaxID=1872407 RepID=UPI0025B92822|nr:hypothetical protein [Aestuariivita sp.]
MSTALIVGAGIGLSASVARKLAARGHDLVLATRDTSDLGDLTDETGAVLVNCDARARQDMEPKASRPPFWCPPMARS